MKINKKILYKPYKIMILLEIAWKLFKKDSSQSAKIQSYIDQSIKKN